MTKLLISLIACACIAGLGCSAGGSSQRTGTGAGAQQGPTPGSTASVPGSASPGSFANSSTPAQNVGTKPAAQQAAPTPMAGGLQPMSIDACGANNPAGLSAADSAKLMAGGGGASSMRWLYPYDGTVFPRGLLPPLLMWDGGSADYVYVHIQASAFEYKGCLKPSADGQLQLPADVWATAGLQTKGASDPFLFELSVMKGGTVQGPIAEHLTIAQATIKGSIYYNSYSSKLAASAAPAAAPGGLAGLFGGTGPGMGSNGAVLRIPPGGMAEVFTSTECNGCHSVSANGSRLLSQAIGAGRSYALAPNGADNPPAMNVSPSDAFGALYPDGSVYLAESLVIDVARSTYTAGQVASTDATLYHTSDGSTVTNTGIPVGALMPMFAPDGSLLVFNDYAINQAHGLALMSYDVKTNTAAGYRMLFSDTDMRPGWPFVLPDDGGVVFTRTDGMDFSGEGAGIAAAMQVQVTGATAPPSSDIYIVDVKSGTSTILAKAMGYDTPDDAKASKTYLPFGAEELHMSYFPTLSPVAAGGYFWLFFDAVRHYGNLGQQRQIWGAAIDIAADGTYSLDPSHPAYYLPGQELGTGNHRAFAALDPCKMNGDTCTSGTDCCGGFCYVKQAPGEFMAEPVGSCTDNTPMCANTNDRCKTSSDCCAPAPGQVPNSCIAGFCAVVRAPS